jgi:hypothetical protein
MAALMAQFGKEGGGTFEQARGILTAASLIADAAPAIQPFGASLGLSQVLPDSQAWQPPLPKTN